MEALKSLKSTEKMEQTASPIGSVSDTGVKTPYRNNKDKYLSKCWFTSFYKHSLYILMNSTYEQ